MSLANLNNPFVNAKVDNTISIPPGDVRELHSAALDQCSAAIAATRLSGQSTSLLVVGEAGSGKSHMIAQLRQQLALDMTTVLVAIPLGGANAGCLWRHVRKQLFTDLLRQYLSTQNGDNGLLRILRNRFPQWVSNKGSGSSVLDLLFHRPDAADTLKEFLDEFAQRHPSFAYNLGVVLTKLSQSELTAVAQAWLRGEQLSESDFSRLGLPPEFPSDIERESIARSAVLSLFELAGDKTALFLFFDEVEAIQAGNYDAAVLRQFATLVTDLLAPSGKRVIAVSIRPTLQIALQKAVEKSNFQKMTQYNSQISPLTWEQSVRIARCRLDAEASCRAARKRYSQDPDWPLGGSFLSKTFAENRRNLTPRHLILACRIEFDRLQSGRPATNSKPYPANGQVDGQNDAAADELNRVWAKQRKKFLERPQSVQFDNVFALGLPWLVELMQMPMVRVHNSDHHLGDVNLLFQPDAGRKKPLGVSFCNHEPKFLWRRLDRLIKQWNNAKQVVLAGLVILRAETARTTDASEARLTMLTKAGVRLVRVHSQQLAELAAFQAMLTATMEGEMTRSGKPVEPKEFDAWSADFLSESVKELLHQVFETCAPKSALPSAAATKKVRVATREND